MMLSDNQNISNKQLKKMLIFDMISISIMILPGMAAGGAGRDGLTAIIIGSLAAVIYSLFFLYVSSKIPGEYMAFSATSAGKILTFIFGLFYIIKLLFAGWFTLALFGQVIIDTLLPDTSLKIIIFTLILVSIYAARKGIEIRARITEIFFYIVIIPLIILLILGCTRVELTNVFPLFTANGNQLFGTSYLALLTYSAVELLLFAAPAHMTEDDKARRSKSVIHAVIITAVINMILFILVVGLLGVTIAAEPFKSSISIMQLIQIPGGFVQRQDAIMLTIWMLTIFTILSAYFYYLTKITNRILPIKKKNYYLAFFGIVLFFLNFVRIPVEALFDYFQKYMSYIGLPQSILIPLIILILSKVRSKKGETDEIQSRS